MHNLICSVHESACDMHVRNDPFILSASYFFLPLEGDLTVRHQSNAIIVCVLSFPLPLRLGIVHCVL